MDVAVIGTGPYDLWPAAHLRARDGEHRTFGVLMGSRPIPAVLAHFQPAPWVPSLDLTALP